MNDLRKRVEALLAQDPDATPTLSTRDVQEVVRELQAHQVELEKLNEGLRQAQIELRESRDRYAELYDIAPVGYLTLDREGLILEANLTAAVTLGAEREGINSVGDCIAPRLALQRLRHQFPQQSRSVQIGLRVAGLMS